MTLAFRNALSHEHAAVARVILKSYAEYGPLLPPDAWERYSQNILDVRSRMAESELLIAVEDGEIVGSATFYPARIKRTQSEWPRRVDRRSAYRRPAGPTATGNRQGARRGVHPSFA